LNTHLWALGIPNELVEGADIGRAFVFPVDELLGAGCLVLKAVEEEDALALDVDTRFALDVFLAEA
jgi:hypothetical protein